MSFDWRKFAQIVEVVAPITLAAAGVPSQFTSLVVHGVQIAQAAEQEGAGPKTGSEKKSIAMDIITTGLSAVNAVKPGTVDVSQLTSVISSGIDDTIAAVKAAKNIPVKPA